MNMPGFTAEATLYQTSRHYRLAASFAQTGEAVVPQQWFPEPTCTYGTCFPEYDLGADPLIRKVVSWHSLRCCSYFGLFEECELVDCPKLQLEWPDAPPSNYCYQQRSKWISKCVAAAPYAATKCNAMGNKLYKQCLETGVWSAP
jgi:hypothetical protein